MRPFLLVIIACGASAQNGGQFKDWNSAPNEARLRPAKSCADLRSLTSYEFSVITAEPVFAKGDTPEYCRVLGQILPEIRFAVDLPSSWNKRLYMHGNGGFAGERLEGGGPAANRMRALRNGFVATGTNT